MGNIKLCPLPNMAKGDNSYISHYTVKPVLRGHLWTNKLWSYKTGDLLKEVQFIRNFL